MSQLKRGAKRLPRRPQLDAMVEMLEPRRMLAEVRGSPGPDEFIIQKSPIEGAVRVAINGSERTVLDDVITILAFEGNDTVTFRFYQPGPSSATGPDIIVDLGPGDDTFDHTQISPQEADPTIIGGTGTDLLLFDHTGDTQFRGLTMDAVGADFRVVHSSLKITYREFETLEYYGSDDSDSLLLRQKAASLSVHIFGQGGNDTFEVGGGDLDDSGFLGSTTELVAGTGSNKITFDDHLDAEGETESCTFDLFSFAKGSSSLMYSAFGRQTLLAANGGSAGAPNTINLNVMSAQLDDTTITGGANRPCTVNVGAGNVASLDGQLTLNLPAALDRVFINDQNAAGAVAYTFDPTRFEQVGGQTFNFTGVESMTLNAGAADNDIAVRGTPAGMFLVVNAGAGSDLLVLGNGDIDTDLLGQVVMSGGSSADTDEAVILNDTNTDLTPQTLIGTSFTDGATHSFVFVDSIRIIEGDAGSEVHIDSTAVPTIIDGGD